MLQTDYFLLLLFKSILNVRTYEIKWDFFSKKYLEPSTEIRGSKENNYVWIVHLKIIIDTCLAVIKKKNQILPILSHFQVIWGPKKGFVGDIVELNIKNGENWLLNSNSRSPNYNRHMDCSQYDKNKILAT